MKGWAEREAALAALVESAQKFIAATDAYEAALGGLARPAGTHRRDGSSGAPVGAEGDMVRAEADLRRALQRLNTLGREI